MASRITVIPDDSTIIVDGKPLVFAFSSPGNLHAIQWHGVSGEVEYSDGTPNLPFGSDQYPAFVQPYEDLWNAEEQKRLELAALTPEQQQEMTQQTFTDAIQRRLDDFARTRGYDGILSAATYATSTVPKFRAEGQYAVEARDMTWAAAYAILGAVMAGERPMPTLEEVFAELPVLAWPEAAV